MIEVEKSQESILPINIVPLDGGKQRSPSAKDAPADMRHWQIEEFLRQTGKADGNVLDILMSDYTGKPNS